MSGDLTGLCLYIYIYIVLSGTNTSVAVFDQKLAAIPNGCYYEIDTPSLTSLLRDISGATAE